jgi:YVTN family beta-propeller protein
MRSRIMIVASIATLQLAGCKSSTSPNGKPNVTHPTGDAATQLIGFGGRPFGLNITSTGDVLVTEQDMNQAVHVDSVGGHAVGVAVGRDPGDVLANAAGTTAFVTGFFDGTLSAVNLATNQVTKTLQVSPSNVYRLALSASGAELYVTSTDGNLYTITTSTLTVEKTLPLPASQGLALNHSGTELYVSSQGGSLWRLDLPGQTTGKSVTLSGCTTQDVALTTDDEELWVACENGTVLILDPTTLETRTTIPLPSAAPFGLAITPDNAQVYVASAQTHNLTIIDRSTHSVVKTLILNGTPRRVAFNKFGNKAYVTNEGNWVDIIE